MFGGQVMKRIALVLAVVLAVAVVAAQERRVITVETMPPVIVKTVPQAGDTEVDPNLKEIKATFSKDMMTEKMWAWSQISAEHFPRRAGKIHYLADKRTCVMPVILEPNRTYCIWLNLGRFNSFRDTGNRPAVSYQLVFKTKD